MRRAKFARASGRVDSALSPTYTERVGAESERGGASPSSVGSPRTAAEIRERILAEHRELRELLAEVLTLSRTVASRDDEESLKLAVRALVLVFGEHLRSEEAVLVPTLERVEPWGPARVERLDEEHATQRAMLKDIFASIGKVDDRTQLAERAAAFATRLLDDMNEEEADLLTPTIFHDAILVVD